MRDQPKMLWSESMQNKIYSPRVHRTLRPSCEAGKGRLLVQSGKFLVPSFLVLGTLKPWTPLDGLKFLFSWKESNRNQGKIPCECCYGVCFNPVWHSLVFELERLILWFLFFFFNLRFYLFISRQRRREGKREGAKHQCVVAPHTPPTGDLAGNPGMCPDWEPNL